VTTTHPCPAGACVPSSLPQFEDPAEALQALRTTLDVRRALDLDWLQAAAAERIAALAADKGKGPAVAANGGAKGSSKSRKAARAAAQHPLAAPAAVLARLRSELRLSKLQAAAVWPVVLYVVGRAEQAVVAGVESMVRQNLVASMAATKENAQGGWVQGRHGMRWGGAISCTCCAWLACSELGQLLLLDASPAAPLRPDHVPIARLPALPCRQEPA
jgi:hypothetical protein